MYAYLFGKRLVMMRPPSSGGIGNRLNAKITRLVRIPACAMRIKNSSLEPKACRKTASSIHIRAITRLAAGPASATKAICFFGLRKLAKLTGTGLA
ncbi:hypothetical protein D3C81_1897710 [compost metagenome]